VAPNGAVFISIFILFLFVPCLCTAATEMTDQQQPQPLQPVAALAQMMAEMATMHREQTEVNLQNLQQLHMQAARQTQVLEGLLFRSETAERQRTSLRGVTLHPMTAVDDPQIFIDMFRATAEACGWPEAEWAVRLLPLLTGDARTAALALPAAARVDFPEVRRAVLDRTGQSPEDHRRRFRGLRLGAGDRPFTFAHQLRDAVVRWMRPGESAGERRMVDVMVLEQFVEGLPTRASSWVWCHRPGTVDEAVTLAEDHLTAEEIRDARTGSPSL